MDEANSVRPSISKKTRSKGPNGSNSSPGVKLVGDANNEGSTRRPRRNRRSKEGKASNPLIPRGMIDTPMPGNQNLPDRPAVDLAPQGGAVYTKEDMLRILSMKQDACVPVVYELRERDASSTTASSPSPRTLWGSSPVHAMSPKGEATHWSPPSDDPYTFVPGSMPVNRFVSPQSPWYCPPTMYMAQPLAASDSPWAMPSSFSNARPPESPERMPMDSCGPFGGYSFEKSKAMTSSNVIYRQRQIRMVKSEKMYKRYAARIRMEDRRPEHPQTPPLRPDLSTKQFDRLRKKWKIDLHKLDRILSQELPPAEMSDAPNAQIDTDQFFARVKETNPEILESMRRVLTPTVI